MVVVVVAGEGVDEEQCGGEEDEKGCTVLTEFVFPESFDPHG